MRSTSVVPGAAVLAAVLALTGCTAADETPHTAPAQAASASSSPATPGDEPTLDPDGTAAANLPLFRAVTADVWAGPDATAGRAYIDALVRAGFAKKDMQVTQDRSTVGNPAESIQFSVRWKDGSCLIGQVGPAVGAPVTAVVPGLADGRCLVGTTRTIDW